ncbi:MAG: copper homeostasis protein CutC [Spirochaetales bacterium]|nr:copper homeostasis protein CutC [Spirochaetales bacterium]
MYCGKHFILFHRDTDGTRDSGRNGEHTHIVASARQDEFREHTDTDTVFHHRNNRRIIDICLGDERLYSVFKENGADGIVFGILTPDGKIDVERSREIIELARPLPVTFHRAFDMTTDAFESLETLISLGVDRVLTSGQEATVPEGADVLAELVERAGDRIIVMPGCGITERNFEKMKNIIKAKEYHIHLPQEFASKMEFHPGHIYMGGLLRQSEFTIAHTSVSRVQNVMKING